MRRPLFAKEDAAKAAGLTNSNLAAAMPPAGPNWIHEIKHDGFRIIKMKNPSAPAVKREAEEDWSKEKWR
jgi:ATP-dependent DNA ligase